MDLGVCITLSTAIRLIGVYHYQGKLALQEEELFDHQVLCETVQLLGLGAVTDLFDRACHELLASLRNWTSHPTSDLVTKIHSSCGALSFFGTEPLRTNLANLERRILAHGDADGGDIGKTVTLIEATQTKVMRVLKSEFSD